MLLGENKIAGSSAVGGSAAYSIWATSSQQTLHDSGLSERTGRVAIIGGGITGLSAAQRIVDKSPATDVTIFESSNRLGGVVQSSLQDGFLFEHSADSFIVSEELPWAGELCQRLGVPLMETSEKYRGAQILRGKTFYPVPDGLQLMTVHSIASVFMSPLLSWRGKLRLAAEALVPPKRNDEDESLEQFAVRRFGREMFDRIIQPLVAGIYTADPAKLSLAAALPQYAALEKKYGTIARGAASNTANVKDKGARYSLFRSPVDGMESLITSLSNSLHGVSIRKSTAVVSLDRNETTSGNSSWLVRFADGSHEEFDAVICTVPVPKVAQIVSGLSSPLASATEGIECVSTAIVCLGYRREQVGHAMNTFGCVIPSKENRKLLAVSFTNVKFPSRAPEGHALLRAFVGGALQPELAELDDDSMLRIIKSELSELLGVRGDPITYKIVRWPRTTPQYHLGHVDRLKEIETQINLLPGFELAGNGYRGVGIPQCVRSGWQAADRLLASLRTDRESNID